MLAVCDGGSTKADWKIWTKNDGLVEITTTGFNPNYNSREQIAAIVQHELADQLDPVQEGFVFYYGTGCWDPAQQQVVAAALRPVFPNTKIEVSHDMLAAARATCDGKPGIACILGTGSNSILFDGERQTDHVDNLGFLLGDEGSGSQIGKKLVQAWCYREMPTELQPIMQQACPGGRREMIEKVYHSDVVPAAYLASFVSLFAGQLEHPFVRTLFRDCFLEFLRRHVCKYENHRHLPVHFVGSVAYFCREILLEALEQLGLQPGNVLHKPILKLLEYHLRVEKGIQIELFDAKSDQSI